MPLFNQPVRLKKLALQSLAKYLADICVHLVNSGRNSKASVREAALAACQPLRCIIHDTIPHSMANCVTSEALKYLGGRYDQISDSVFYEPLSKNILDQFINAILHPQVTELDLVGIRMRIVDVVLNQIETLSELNTFRACVRYKKKHNSFKYFLPQRLSFLKNLKCFTLPVCSSDEIISALSKSAPELTHLDVSESEDVTDESIDIILSFPYLQSLDVSRTGISDGGYKKLLERSRSCLHLKDFGLNIVDSSHILSLPHCFEGLRRLSLSMESSGMKYLDDIARLLQGLEELTICVPNMISVPYFPTLKVLVLNVSQVNVPDLPTNCPRLEKLVVLTARFVCSRFREPFRYLHTLSVCITYSLTIAPLLSAAPNLVTFHLVTTPISYNDISFVNLFSKSLKPNLLEELSILPLNLHIRPIRPEILSRIMDSCSRLKTFYMFHESREWIKSRYRNCTGVKINQVKWCGRHLNHLRP